MGLEEYEDDYGSWKVIGYRQGGHGAQLYCECQCGKRRWVLAKNLKRGRSTCCGCKLRDGRPRKGSYPKRVEDTSVNEDTTSETVTDTMSVAGDDGDTTSE